MHSICYVILPLGILKSEIYDYVKNQLAPYYSELEVDPYKHFQTKEYTYWNAERLGFGKDLSAYAKHLQDTDTDVGIENEQLYFIITNNPKGKWDYFSLEDDTQTGKMLNNTVPYSIVTLDGKWYSEMDFGYKPILDFNNNFKIHKDNLEPSRKWKEFMKTIYKNYGEYDFAILDIHS